MASAPPPTEAGSTGEFDRIARHFRPLAAGTPGALSLLDDAGLVVPPPGQDLVVTTDAMVAGVHFLASDPPGDIAHKLLAVNLSDLAAKGARPLVYSLVTALPRDLPDSWLAAFAAGLGLAQQRWGIGLLGGDSVSTPGPISLTISAVGTVPAGRMVRRFGARPGDIVCVSGTIGDAALGLRLALGDGALTMQPQEATFLLERLRRPEPRLGLAAALREHATAAVDISDGLVADLGHIARGSGVRLDIRLGQVPLSDPARALVAADAGLLPQLLCGGDDYEVGFTLSDARLAALRAATDIPVSVIGRVTGPAPEGDIVVRDGEGNPLSLDRRGWQHF